MITDPGLPQGWNRYAYVLGNPVKYTDPDGRIAQLFHDLCFIQGACSNEFVEVVDEDPGVDFNPLTGVQGLSDLVAGRGLQSAFEFGAPLANGLNIDGRNEFRVNPVERGLSSLDIDGTEFGNCVEQNRFDLAAVTAFSIGNPIANKLAGDTGRMGFGGLAPHPTSWQHKLGAKLSRSFRNPVFSRVGKFAGRAALGVTVFEGFYDIGTIGRCAVVTGGN